MLDTEGLDVGCELSLGVRDGSLEILGDEDGLLDTVGLELGCELSLGARDGSVDRDGLLEG